MAQRHVAVLVLGDVGRSPRMQYHALSLSTLPEVGRVSLLGYRGERVLPEIAHCDKIKLCPIESSDLPWLRKIRFLHVIYKGLALVLAIWLALMRLPSYDTILIQNPPGIPAVFVCIIMSWWNRSRIVVDWHNLGFSVFQEQLGAGHVLVKLSRFLEYSLCAQASHHLCVSKALQKWLKNEFMVRSEVFYDRPASIFQADGLDVLARHALLQKLGFCPEALFPPLDPRDSVGPTSGTIQTTVINNKTMDIRSHPARTALVMSATSWTADEDFQLLLDALLMVEDHLRLYQKDFLKSEFNRVLCVITGKGEMKQSFVEKVSALEKEGKLGRFVVILTKWLETEDYPKLMSCADLGISLHTSTSGLDLPMKVLDMFGSGVPVCAFDFPTLSELVQHGVNGMVFSNKGELSAQLIQLLFNYRNIELAKLKACATQIEHWEEQWNRVVRPYLFTST